jgi:hypothetical protein
MLIDSRENKLANTSDLGISFLNFLLPCRERDLWVWWAQEARPALKNKPQWVRRLKLRWLPTGSMIIFFTGLCRRTVEQPMCQDSEE